MDTVQYSLDKSLTGISFEDAITRVTEALQKEGFGVLTEIDVKSTLKKKIEVDFRKYQILGACNPILAQRALEVEPQMGLLLPCNVVVQELDDGEVLVSITNPKTMFKLVDKPELESVVEEVDSRLRRVWKALG